MTDYETVKDFVNEIIIKRSRFITYLYRIEDSIDAENKLTALRKKHYDATHVCYAYVADENGNELRYSDDGEPSGTAGQPILDALKKSGVKKTLVAVVRYFGGTLLGAGGLVRAYSSSCSEAIAKVAKIKMKYRDIYQIDFDFSTYRKIESPLKRVCEILSIEYTTCITVRVCTSVGYDFKSQLDSICATNTSPKFLGSEYVMEK